MSLWYIFYSLSCPLRALCRFLRAEGGGSFQFSSISTKPFGRWFSSISCVPGVARRKEHGTEKLFALITFQYDLAAANRANYFILVLWLNLQNVRVVRTSNEYQTIFLIPHSLMVMCIIDSHMSLCQFEYSTCGLCIACSWRSAALHAKNCNSTLISNVNYLNLENCINYATISNWGRINFAEWGLIQSN